MRDAEERPAFEPEDELDFEPEDEAESPPLLGALREDEDFESPLTRAAGLFVVRGRFAAAVPLDDEPLREPDDEAAGGEVDRLDPERPAVDREGSEPDDRAARPELEPRREAPSAAAACCWRARRVGVSQ